MSQILHTLMPNHVSKEIMEKLIKEGFVRENGAFRLNYKEDRHVILIRICDYKPNVIQLHFNGIDRNFTFQKEEYYSFFKAYQELLDFIKTNKEW